MNVRPEDGVCRSCGGRLQIVDFDDVSLTVTCLDCADGYDVESDAFGGGCMTYYFPLLVARFTRKGGGASDAPSSPERQGRPEKASP